ncbi:MurR/RpiR family transcriptional regulator [Vallitaleaceae bacterium 9-2]
MNDKTVMEVIQENYNDIFSAEKKVADYVLKNPQDAVNATVAELAAKSGVSDATVVRMCRHLGYTGYYQFKVMLAKYVGRYEEDNNESSNENEMNAMTKILNRYAESVVEIGENIEDEVLHECIKLMNSCKQVHILAVGNTTPLALYMGFRLGRLGIHCSFGIAPEYFMNHVNLASPEDIIFAISQSGSSRQVIQGMELAKDKGLKSIAITGVKTSPVAELADYALISSNRKESFSYYRSYAHLKETALIDALIELLTNWATIESKDADKPEIILSEYKY